MRIGINTTLNTNPGDDWIREGALYLLRKILPPFEPILAQKHISNRWTLQDVIEQNAKIMKCDLLVQAGSPVYWQDVAYMHKGEWPDLFWRKAPEHSILALASGSCYQLHWKLEQLHKDDREFITMTLNRSKLFTTRDKMAQRVAQYVCPNTPVETFPCTAFWAQDGLAMEAKPTYPVLNYMPGGGHFYGTQYTEWKRIAAQYYQLCLQKFRNCKVICHNPAEVQEAKSFAKDSDIVYHTDYHKLLEAYSQASFGLVNRIHGSCILCSFGVPNICVGRDTRMQVIEFIGGTALDLNIFLQKYQNAAQIIQELTANTTGFLTKMVEQKTKYTPLYSETIRKSLQT